MGKENVTRAHHKMDHILESSSETNLDELSTYIDHLAQKIEKDYEYTQLEARLAELEKKKVTSTIEENTRETSTIEMEENSHKPTIEIEEHKSND